MTTLPELDRETASSALLRACEAGDLGQARYLLTQGADPQASDGRGTTLHRACGANRTDIIGLLLGFGVDPDLRDGQGWAPLHTAAADGRLDALRLLLGAGATVDAPGGGGKTALMVACAAGHGQTAAELLRAGAGVDARDDDGRTALVGASYAGCLAEVTTLLKAGAAPLLSDRFGHPPLYFAAFSGHLDVARLLARLEGPLDSARTEEILEALAPAEAPPPPWSIDLCVELVEASAPHSRWLWLDGWSSYLAESECEAVAALKRPPSDECLLFPCARIKRTDVASKLGRTELISTGFRALICVDGLTAGEYAVSVLATGPRGARRLTLESPIRLGQPLSMGEVLVRPVVISTHIPKTAGLSFGAVLEGRFPARVFHDYLDPNVPHIGARAYLDYSNVLLPPRAECIHGHFLATKYDRAFPSARHAAWLREPGQRLMSAFYYAARERDLGRDFAFPIDDLVGFADSESQRDLQSVYLDGKGITEFAFVGIVEHMDRSLELFRRTFGGGADLTAPDVNVNPGRRRGEAYEVPAALRLIIEDHHAADVDLYRRACERFEELCRLHGV